MDQKPDPKWVYRGTHRTERTGSEFILGRFVEGQLCLECRMEVVWAEYPAYPNIKRWTEEVHVGAGAGLREWAPWGGPQQRSRRREAGP